MVSLDLVWLVLRKILLYGKCLMFESFSSSRLTATHRYIGTFLGTSGSNGVISTILSWQQNNVIGDAKRSVSSAILVSASGISGIYSSLTFRQQDIPNYVPGIIAVIASFAVWLVLAILTSLLMSRQNRLADQSKKVLIEDIPSFRYTL